MNGTMVAVEKKPREIWVEFGSNPSPLLHSFATIVPGFFIYFVLFTEWGMGGGGVRYETEEKEASPSSGEKNSNLTSFLQFVAFSVSFSAVLFKGKIFIKFQIQIYRKMCGQLFFFIEHWQKDIRWI